MASRLRLDQLLVARGICADRDEARRLIMSGRVMVNDHRRDQAAESVDVNAGVRIKSRGGRFVSRGGEKLEGALAHFSICVDGRVALDLGASTGGFTDCLLRAGARRVYAVDVGTNQLDYRLRCHARVICLERTHANQLGPDLVPEPIEFVSADVSFTGLERVLPYVLPLLSHGADLLVLFKPQFQAPRDWVEPGGLVTNSARVEHLLADFSIWLHSVDLTELGRIPSQVRGAKGNREWFFWLRWRGEG